MRNLLAPIFLFAAIGCATAESLSAEPAPYALPNTASFELTSTRLERSYPILVSLPPDYDENASTPYPVVLVNDGPYAFPIAAESLNVPMVTGVLEKVILVGIGFAAGEDQMASRMRDYTPTEDPNWNAFDVGGAAAYADFLEAELLPLIEERYNADPKRRTLVGHSAGGLFGAWILLDRPQLFESFILVSPALFYDQKTVLRLESAYAKQHDDLPARVYLAVGSTEQPPQSPFEWVKDQEAFAGQLRARGYASLEVHSEVIDQALHETSFPQGFIRGAQWLFSAESPSGGPEQ